jgi:DNA-binding transcriptional ArsR family regulator
MIGAELRYRRGMAKSPPLQPIHDPRALRAIAHPVRTRILDEMSAQGPMRAADIARELDIPANSASFHLRQLARYGLVQEDEQAARDRRDRVWRLVSPEGFSIGLGSFDQRTGGKAAASAYRRNARAWGQVVIDAAYDDTQDPSTHRSVTDIPLRLTKDEATEFAAEVRKLAGQWRKRRRDSDDDRRTYTFLAVVVPRPQR